MSNPELITNPEVFRGANGTTKFRRSCDQCRRSSPDFLVQVGEEPDWETATASLCKDCLLKALALFPPAEDMLVIITKTNNGYAGIRCDSYDSYSIGRILQAHYSDPAKVRELVDLGNLSKLGEEIGKKHSPDWRSEYWGHDNPETKRVLEEDDPRGKMCEAYGRDHKVRGFGPYVGATPEEVVEKAGNATHVYLFIYEDGEWRAGHCQGPLEPLEVVLSSIGR